MPIVSNAQRPPSLGRHAPVKKAARVPQGKHGTPEWNPGSPTPEQTAKRATDPLWMYHRGQIDLRGRPYGQGSHSLVTGIPRGIEPHRAALVSQLGSNDPNHPPDYWRSGVQPPIGFADHSLHDPTQGGRGYGAAEFLALPHATENSEALESGYLDPATMSHGTLLDTNIRSLHGQHGQAALNSLQNFRRFAAKGDPYRIWAASILGSNRHAIPHLVQLLQKRDNPAGWWKGWSDLHRRMEREQGNLTPQQVAERIGKIIEAIKSDPEHARHLTSDFMDSAEAGKRAASGQGEQLEGTPFAREQERDFTPYHHMTDAMDEAGMEPHWSSLVKSELANVIPDVMAKPRGSRRFARKAAPMLRKRRRKRKIKRHTVLQPWQTGGGNGGSCQYARDGLPLVSQLRLVDQQILDYVRSGRVIPRNLLQMAVNLHQQMEELGMDSLLLPVPYKRRYAAHDDPTGMMVTRRAGKGEMDAPTYSPMKTPVVTSYLKHYTDIARNGTQSVPGKRMSVFVVHRNHKPVSFAVSSQHHEPYSVNGLDHVLHSTWEGGRVVQGNPFSGHPKSESGERMQRRYSLRASTQRRYAANDAFYAHSSADDIPFAEVVGPHEGAGFEPGLGRALPVFPNPYKGTPDEREHRDAPWNKWSQAAGAATREAHAAKIAMRQIGGVPLDHPIAGADAYHRHIEAMANAIRTNPNSLPVHDYLREAMYAGEKRYDQERMVNAAKRLLMVAKSDPKNKHLNVFQRFADAEAKEREPQSRETLDAPQAGLGTVADSGTPTHHDIDLSDEEKMDPKGGHFFTHQQLRDAARLSTDDWAGGRKRGPREAPVVSTKPGRGKKEVATRTGFMEHMLSRGVPDAEAISELGLQHMISPQQAKRMWTAFRKSKAVQKQRMSRVLQIVKRMRGAA